MTQTSPLLARYAAFAIKRGLLLGGLMSSCRADFDLLVTSAALAIPDGILLTEREVNESLQTWLSGPGVMLDVDHVELRRWLVDLGLLARDKAGMAYQRTLAGEPFAGIAAELADVNLAQWVADVAAAETERREARKAAWQAKAAQHG